MNNIFLKNLASLTVKNPKLAKRLESYIPQEIPELVQKNGAFNLLYRGKYIHNEENPLAEAKEIFLRAENEPVSIHLVYGIGLGYLFQFASMHSKGTVILYEPDLNILKTALMLVDFSADIIRENVFITSDYDEVSGEIYKKSGMKNSPQLLSLTSVREFDPEGFNELVRKLQELVGSYALDLKYTKKKNFPSLKMLIKNIPSLLNEVPLIRLKDSLSGKTAVVVSAGPSLDRDIDILKKYRSRFVLFTVGTALKTLSSHGITPDFVCIIENFDSSNQLEGTDLSEVYFITEPQSNPAMRKFKFKKILSHISANTPVNRFWSDISGENIEEYWSKGTVSYTALNSARILGCSKIILCGQDLAYLGGQCYSKDSIYKDLICAKNPESNRWEIQAKDFESFMNRISAADDPQRRRKQAIDRLQRLNSTMYYVKSIKGDMIPTESVYAMFIEPLTEFTQNYPDRKYINTSLEGAQIDGYENLPLEDALADSDEVGKINLNTEFSIDKAEIFKNLESEINELKKAVTATDECESLAKSLNNDLKRTQNADEKILKKLRNLSVAYLKLASDFTAKSKIFSFITLSDKIDLDYEMKMAQKFDHENISKITAMIAKYCKNAKDGIYEVEKLVKEAENESSYTKS